MTIIVNVDNQKNIDDVVRTLKSRVGVWEVTIQKPARTYRQLKYYWAVVIAMLCQEMGVTNVECHEYMKCTFLKVLKHLKGVEYFDIKSTAELTTTEFAHYIEQCAQFAAEQFGIVIPPPSPLIMQ